MIFEHRLYKIAPNRMEELIERFEKYTLRLFKKHGIEAVLFCTPSDSKDDNMFFYIVKFKNKDEMKKCWSSFIKDEERIKIWDESNRNGKLVLSIESKVFDLVEMSGF